MTEDIVRAFGFLTLGSRFRRIGEKLQADTQEIIEQSALGIQAGQCPLLAAIDRAGPLTIGELAEAVGITQPGATRTVNQLIDAGFVEARASDEDQRRKLISLTEKGQSLVDMLRCDVWPNIEAAVHDLCGHLDGPLLAQLGAIEDGLADKPLIQRAGQLQEKVS